jgi:flagellar protein FlaG
MPLITNPVVPATAVAQAQPLKHNPVNVNVPQAVEALEKVPASKAEPLVDPVKLRANLEAAIERLNEQAERNGRGLKFALDEKLNRPIITVVNSLTGEVVRTIPDEVVIRVAHGIEDFKGVLMDEKM